MQHRPPVRGHDESGAETALDVLQGGSERDPRFTPATRRRLRLGVAASVLLVSAAAAAAELDEWRAAAAAERRLGSVLALTALEDVSVNSSYDTRRREARLELVVHVRNDGPRPVRVLVAQLGAYRWAAEEQLLPQRRAAFPLTGAVRCSVLPPPPQGRLDQLLVEARTATGIRSQTLTLPVELADVAARACGHLPTGEAVGVGVLTPVPAGDAVVLPLEVSSHTVRPIALVSVAAPPGLGIELQHSDRTPVALPLQLPTTTPGSVATLQVRAVLTVEDCGATAAASDLADVRLTLRDDAGEAQVHLAFDTSALASLISQQCSLSGHAGGPAEPRGTTESRR